jgi:hypothetical protein
MTNIFSMELDFYAGGSEINDSELNGSKHWPDLICSWLGECDLDMSLSFPNASLRITISDRRYQYS